MFRFQMKNMTWKEQQTDVVAPLHDKWWLDLLFLEVPSNIVWGIFQYGVFHMHTAPTGELYEATQP